VTRPVGGAQHFHDQRRHGGALPSGHAIELNRPALASPLIMTRANVSRLDVLLGTIATPKSDASMDIRSLSDVI
jgi:hypothetical protein